jgi:ribosome-binding ATPase YchF (GTP1/OBG family)
MKFTMNSSLRHGRCAAEVKLKGKPGRLLHLKGKDYVVEDGDIVHIRHSG